MHFLTGTTVMTTNYATRLSFFPHHNNRATVQEEIHIWTYFLSLPNRDGPFLDRSQAGGDKPTLSRYHTSVYVKTHFTRCVYGHMLIPSPVSLHLHKPQEIKNTKHLCSDCRRLTRNKFPASALLVRNKSHLEPLQPNHSSSFPHP